jgi:hypothetical protein
MVRPEPERNGRYVVHHHGDTSDCNCPDFELRQEKWKLPNNSDNSGRS